ncbi:MAG TPA: cysteine--tRNA ligase, partial [Candidatus Omnitrophota bacterium]|nr:cysteine--tRNA ligase [Candidatus Omnitrophota bacterium]
TVYDKCHIGHARSLYIFDVIKRYLQYRGYNVTLIRNITDVDDKIIYKAKELNKSFEDVVKENIDLYHEDLEKLGVSVADVEPRATENIQEMISHIEGLIDKGYAYESEGDVYFSVRQFKDYGKLSGQSVDKMLEAVRIDKDEKKKDPLDFALWKKSKEGDPFWESPWGLGRPGWHIECSAMSKKYAGCETLDIHAGGRDLIFPHHENEIAQSEALSGKPFAKYWIHHGLLTINGQKMAKSLGNFITIEDALKKYVSDDLKLFFLTSHYASPIDYTDEKMLDAFRSREKLINFLRRIHRIKDKYGSSLRPSDFVDKRIKGFTEEFSEAMDDDFNTPKALAAIFNFITDINKFIDSHEENIKVDVLSDWSNKFLKKILGLKVEDIVRIERFHLSIPGITVECSVALSGEEKEKVRQFVESRKKGDFKESDRMRNAFKEKGIVIENTKNSLVIRKA